MRLGGEVARRSIMMSPEEQLEKIAKSQSRQKIALIVLSIALVASLIVTWKSLATVREIKALQQEQLALQKPESAPQAAPAKKPNARTRVKANVSAETHALSTSKTHTGERESATPAATGTAIASVRVPERQGRQ
jgi:Na+-transporting NADH:ubiquinone oxidoreductase subunit NqrC